MTGKCDPKEHAPVKKNICSIRDQGKTFKKGYLVSKEEKRLMFPRYTGRVT